MARVLIIAALAVLALASPAAAATYKLIGSKTGSGDFAIALASGTASHPKGVYVSVVATPSQSVDVTWTMVCGKGFSAGSKSGTFTTSRSAKHKLKMPASNPDSCTVSASGSLSRGGRITVRLYSLR